MEAKSPQSRSDLKEGSNIMSKLGVFSIKYSHESHVKSWQIMAFFML